MNRNEESLRRGRVYLSATKPLDKLLVLAGVPKEHWNAGETDIVFDTFRAERVWRNSPDLFAFTSKDQFAAFEGILAAIKGTGNQSYDYLAGSSIVITSEFSAIAAERVASVIVKTLVEYDNRSVVGWYNANERDRWGRPAGIDWEIVPDLVVISGLTDKAISYEAYETVDRLREWATRFCPCILVGSGANPIKIAFEHYRFKPNMAFYSNSVRGKAKVLG